MDPRLCSFRSLLLAFVLTAFSSAWAEDKAGEGRWNIVAECQMVVVPQKVVWPLIPDLGDDEKFDAAWTKLQQMIEHGEATLIADLSLRGEPETKLVTHSGQELRYASEFTPPQLPYPLPKGKEMEVLKHWPLLGPTPTAFETRNVGAHLELTATVSEDGQWIAAAIDAQHVRLLRMAKIEVGILASGERLSVEQPCFSTLQNRISLQVRSGQRVLIGLHKIPTEEDKMELFFLWVRAQHAGTGK